MTVKSVSATDRAVEMTDSGVIRVPVGGSLKVAANGYLPGSPVTVFAIPLGSGSATKAGLLRARAQADNAIELGLVYANGHGEISDRIVVEQSVVEGGYVLQVNGFTPLMLRRSVNVRMNVIAGTQDRAGVVREAGFFAARAATFTKAGLARLDALVDAVPADARDTKVTIVAVSLSMGTPGENVRMASKRAQALVDHLVERGVKGDYDITIKTTFTVDGAERATTDADSTERASRGSRTLSADDAPVNPSAPSLAPDGRPLTTATITFTAPQPL